MEYLVTNFTPTTADILAAYRGTILATDRPEVFELIDQDQADAEFNRWLAEHDREVIREFINQQVEYVRNVMATYQGRRTMTEYTQKNEEVRIMSENKLSVVEVLRTSWGSGVRPEAICANLQYADLNGADLQDANLQYANLQGADLQGANLWGANLRYANLRYANILGVFQHHGLPSGAVLMIPTVDGWHLTVDCWSGTREQLRELISQNEGWPEARGAEVERRRPRLLEMLALADAHADYHADVLQAVVEKWGDKND